MASNNYYNNHASQNSPYDWRENPLPPLPLQSPSFTSLNKSSKGPPGTISPISSPFEDEAYPASNQSYRGQSQQSLHASNTSYHGGYQGGRNNDQTQNPFSDNIALEPTNSKRDAWPTRQHGAETQSVWESDEPRHRRGILGKFAKKRAAGGLTPWFCYIMAVIQFSVFIAEIVRNATLTGSPIMIHPSFNPMIGPSTYVLINMGARFVPCMRSTVGVQDSKVPINWPCPNTTTSSADSPMNMCKLSDLCGFSGVPNPKEDGTGTIWDTPQPNQWFRFIIPMFLHAGIIHISFNMLLQLTLGRDMEKAIGHIRFALVYFSSGIFGFVLGGNFAATGIASTGASGCLFGVLALVLLDLIYTWGQRESPVKDLCFIFLDVAISFVLGLLPGLDNFSHIGGFLMGLVLGICILHSPNALRERIGMDAPPYQPMLDSAAIIRPEDENGGMKGFFKQPVGFFKGRKPLWWVWWILRAGALVGVFVGFIVLLNNFYKYRDTCSWCKYLSCLPINNWCDLGNLHLTNTNSTTTNKARDLLTSAVEVPAALFMSF